MQQYLLDLITYLDKTITYCKCRFPRKSSATDHNLYSLESEEQVGVQWVGIEDVLEFSWEKSNVKYSQSVQNIHGNT